MTSWERTPRESWSADIARRASAGRASGSGPATTGRRKGSPPPWTPWKRRARRPHERAPGPPGTTAGVAPMDMSMMAAGFLAAMAAGGVAYVFLYPLLSGEARAEKRQKALVRSSLERRVDR